MADAILTPEPAQAERAFHPVASIFPLMGEAELAELSADIEASGQRELIWLHRDGSIIDGRNRWLACRRLGIPCKAQVHEGDDAALVAFVLSLNLRRRHLNESQRAMVAIKVRDFLSANLHSGDTAEAAARLMNVSRRTVMHAATVQQEGAPELVAAVERGEVAVSAAAREATEARKPRDIRIHRVTVSDGEGEEPTEPAKVLPHKVWTGDHEWYTPPKAVDAARRVMGGIDLDPASSEAAQRAVRAARYFTAETDGLARPWRGRAWLNPPYSSPLIGRFVAKLLAEHLAGCVTQAVVLVDNRTDTRWFHALARRAAALCLTFGRIPFKRPDGTGDSPTNGSCFVYLGRDVDKFAKVFGEIGLVFRGPIAWTDVRPSWLEAADPAPDEDDELDNAA
jgi:phage N-6-adenine-methyltransferase